MAKKLELQIVIGAQDNYSGSLTAAQERVKEFGKTSESSMGVTVNAMKKTADATTKLSGALNVMKEGSTEAGASLGKLHDFLLPTVTGMGLFFTAILKAETSMGLFNAKARAVGAGLRRIDELYVKTNLGVLSLNRELFESISRWHMFSLGLYGAGLALSQMDSNMARMAGKGLQILSTSIMLVTGGLNTLIYMAGKAASWMGDKLVSANDKARQSYDKIQFALIALQIGIDDYNSQMAGAALTMEELMNFTSDLAAETGIARVEIKSAAAGLLEMNKTYGLTKDQLTQVMDRTAKFATIMNIPFRSALQAVENAMSGNAMRARNMGLELNEAAIAQANVGTSAENASRPIQVFGAFMKQTDNIAQRFPETMSTVIGQQNRLTAVMTDANIVMGKGARLAWNPMINVTNLWTEALKAVPDEILGTIGFLREQAGVILQITGFTLKWIATLGALFFAAKGFILMTGWVSAAGTAMAGFSGVIGILGKTIVGLRSAMVLLRVSMLGILGPIGLAVTAVAAIVWAYKRYTSSVEAAELANGKLVESQKKLVPPNEQAQKQIERLLLTNRKLGATKEELLKIAIEEFTKIGANTKQVRIYTDALEAQAAKEAEIAASKTTPEITPQSEFIGPEITAAERLSAEYEAKLVVAREYTDIEAERYKTQLEDKYFALEDSLVSENDLIKSHYAQQKFIVDTAYKRGIISASKRDKILAKMDIKDKKDEAMRNIAAARLKLSVATTVSRTIRGLLAALPDANREISIAMIAIDKGLAIAEIIIWAEVAKMRALAVGAPQMGPVIEAMKWVSVAMIAATGFVEAGTAGGGGGGISPVDLAEPATAGLGGGDTTEPLPPAVFDMSAGGGMGAETQPIGQQVNVTINVDNMISPENLQEIVDEQIIPAINNANERDVVLEVA